jgi:15-cis-phytoene synthase
VASVVGLTIVHIFGFESPEALSLAEKCGIAFQLTNIIRDVREDAANDRLYVPAEDLSRFNVGFDELVRGEDSERFRDLMAFEAARAESYYDVSLPLIGLVDPNSRSSLRALIEIYRCLLSRIERANFDVLTRRIRVPLWRKLWIVARGFLSRAN